MSLRRRRDLPARQQQSVLAWPTGCQLAKRSVTHPTGVFYTFSDAVHHMIHGSATESSRPFYSASIGAAKVTLPLAVDQRPE
jgi:hypothetical protein